MLRGRGWDDDFTLSAAPRGREWLDRDSSTPFFFVRCVSEGDISWVGGGEEVWRG